MHRGKSSNDRKSKAQVLAEMGVSVQNANRYEQLAAMPAEHFETAAAAAKPHPLDVLSSKFFASMPDFSSKKLECP